MTPAPSPPASPGEAVSRLCTGCGMCCTGVMFHHVCLQPGDSPKQLAALGLKLKRKNGKQYILQPCPAHRGGQCSIYLHRPERCRRFECRQIAQFTAGTISEAEAAETIRQTLAQTALVESLLQRAGDHHREKPYSRRCERILAEPPDADHPVDAQNLRADLAQAAHRLEELLERHFRVGQPPGPSPDQPSPETAPPALIPTGSTGRAD